LSKQKTSEKLSSRNWKKGKTNVSRERKKRIREIN